MARAICFLLFSILLCSPAAAQRTEPTRVLIHGLELHYIERGQGEPLILLHGGQGDYRAWGPQIETLARRYRVISYSRRYNYPNDNPISARYRSAYSDADDLAAFIRRLKLGRVHLVGTSAGALAALVLAIDQPALVRSLVLAEPPVHRWAKDDPKGEPLYRQFMSSIWEPAAAAFGAHDPQRAMKVLIDGFGGEGRFESLSPDARAVVMQNSRFFEASTGSSDPFPPVSRQKVRRLRMPVLIVAGENTIPLHRFVVEELARLLPNAERVTIPRAGHGSPRENPQAFNDAVATFLARHDN